MSIPAPSPHDHLAMLEAEWKQADKACDDFIATDAQIRRHRVRFQLKPECERTLEDKHEIILLVRRLLTDGDLPMLHHVGTKLAKPLTPLKWAFRRQRAMNDPALAESRATVVKLDQVANDAHTKYHRQRMTLRPRQEMDSMEETMLNPKSQEPDVDDVSVNEAAIDSDYADGHNAPKQSAAASLAQRAKGWVTRTSYKDTVQDVTLPQPGSPWVEKSRPSESQANAAQDAHFNR